jgi:type II secretion system protein N
MLTVSPEKLRRARRIAGQTAFGFLVFTVALYIWFPYGRAREVAINLAAAQNLDVEIESAGPTWGLGVRFKDIRVKTRPTTGKPTRFTIESASVSVGLFSLLFSSSPSFDVSLDAFGGRIDFAQSGTPSASGKKGPFRIEISARDVNMSELPGIREALNLPVAGTLKVDLEIASPTGRFSNAKGALSLLCAGLVLGDGKSPLRVEGNAFLGGGLTLPKVRVGDLRGDVAIEAGTAKLKNVEAKSPDAELALEGEVLLRDPFANSIVNAYLRFKLSDAFLKAAPTLQTILQMAAASGKRPDGAYGLRLGGRLAQMTPPVLSPTSQLGGPLPPGRGGANRPGIAPSYVPPPPNPAPAMQVTNGAVAPVPETPPPPPPPSSEPQPTPPTPPATPPPPPPATPAPDVQQGTLRGTPPPAPSPVTDETKRAGPDGAGQGGAGEEGEQQ